LSSDLPSGLLWRRHQAADGTLSEAVYSLCEAYRYRLTRRWGPATPLIWIMLNPSTATEAANDPTIERVCRRSRALGAGGVAILNLCAYRATAPADLWSASDPVGPDNGRVIDATVERGARVVAGWGVHGARKDLGPEMLARLRARGASVVHLGLTKDGHPRHPLYVPYAQQPSAFLAAGSEPKGH